MSCRQTIYAPAEAMAFPNVPTRKSISLIHSCSSAHPNPFSLVHQKHEPHLYKEEYWNSSFELNESGKISFIAIHAEDAFGNNNNLLISVMIFSNQSLQLGNIIVTIPDTFS